jgi:hypothetical protein
MYRPIITYGINKLLGHVLVIVTAMITSDCIYIQNLTGIYTLRYFCLNIPKDQVIGGNSTSSFSSYMALQPILGLGLLFMRFRNLTHIDGW